MICNHDKYLAQTFWLALNSLTSRVLLEFELLTSQLLNTSKTWRPIVCEFAWVEYTFAMQYAGFRNRLQ